MENHRINVRVRMVIIKEGKLLTQYNQDSDYYYYIGGHLEYGETVLDACQREIHEECGSDTEFTFKKILYIRDFILPEKNEHSLELFILGDVNKFMELEKMIDPESKSSVVWATWLDLNHLPDNLLPHSLTPRMLADYHHNFPHTGVYVGRS